MPKSEMTIRTYNSMVEAVVVRGQHQVKWEESATVCEKKENERIRVWKHRNEWNLMP